MTPKSLGTCVIQPPGLSHHNCLIIRLRSKVFEAPMLTYSSWSSRSWLIVRPAIQQQVGLDALNRLYEAKGFNPDLLRSVRRRVEPNEHVDPICIVGVFAHLRLLMCDCVHVCIVWSWLLFVCLCLSFYWHGVGASHSPARRTQARWPPCSPRWTGWTRRWR